MCVCVCVCVCVCEENDHHYSYLIIGEGGGGGGVHGTCTQYSCLLVTWANMICFALAGCLSVHCTCAVPFTYKLLGTSTVSKAFQ